MQSRQESSKKNEQDTYNAGFPTVKGWYDCLVDGEQMQLYCFVCELDRRKRYWIDQDRQKVLDKVLWR